MLGGTHMMTIRAEIIGGDIPLPRGWVEVDPFDYEYTGEDPDGEITAFLEDVANETVEFGWPADVDSDGQEYSPRFKLLGIRQNLQQFDEIWYVELPDDFKVEY